MRAEGSCFAPTPTPARSITSISTWSRVSFRAFPPAAADAQGLPTETVADQIAEALIAEAKEKKAVKSTGQHSEAA